MTEILCFENKETTMHYRYMGSGVLNPGVVLLRFVLTLWGQFSNPAGQSLTLN